MSAWNKGPAGLLERAQGRSHWQPQPTHGYATLKFCPESFPYDAAEDVELFVWVTPPGYEEQLAFVGRPRRSGEAAPEPFDAPEDAMPEQARAHNLEATPPQDRS